MTSKGATPSFQGNINFLEIKYLIKSALDENNNGHNKIHVNKTHLQSYVNLEGFGYVYDLRFVKRWNDGIKWNLRKKTIFNFMTYNISQTKINNQFLYRLNCILDCDHAFVYYFHYDKIYGPFQFLESVTVFRSAQLLISLKKKDAFTNPKKIRFKKRKFDAKFYNYQRRIQDNKWRMQSHRIYFQ